MKIKYKERYLSKPQGRFALHLLGHYAIELPLKEMAEELERLPLPERIKDMAVDIAMTRPLCTVQELIDIRVAIRKAKDSE